MPHCPRCSYEGDHSKVVDHMDEKSHKGDICEGRYERVVDRFLTKDAQFACFRCGRIFIKPYIES